MKKLIYTLSVFTAIVLIMIGCKEDTFEMGDLNAPTNIQINTVLTGQESDPEGDGSGEVLITVSANDAITYHIGFNLIGDYGDVSYAVLDGGTKLHKFTSPGVNTYRISVIAFGPGGTASNASKDITVRSDFKPDPALVTNLTNDGSKTWIVDKDVAGHFGVAWWDQPVDDIGPHWWAAGVDEKLECCSCFYSATFTFNKVPTGYTLDVDAPDGVFTKTGDLTNLPGVPDSGDEGCYDGYTGGSGNFEFIPASSGIIESLSTQVSMNLSSTDIFIGYGALLSEYEILEITDTYMYLRVQGTETGNSWYLKLKPAP